MLNCTVNAYNATKTVFIRRYASVLFNNAGEQLHSITAFYKIFMFLGTSMVTNIITIFTGLAGLIHVQAEYKVGCSDKDLTRGR